MAIIHDFSHMYKIRHSGGVLVMKQMHCPGDGQTCLCWLRNLYRFSRFKFPESKIGRGIPIIAKILFKSSTCRDFLLSVLFFLYQIMCHKFLVLWCLVSDDATIHGTLGKTVPISVLIQEK